MILRYFTITGIYDDPDTEYYGAVLRADDGIQASVDMTDAWALSAFCAKLGYPSVAWRQGNDPLHPLPAAPGARARARLRAVPSGRGMKDRIMRFGYDIISMRGGVTIMAVATPIRVAPTAHRDLDAIRERSIAEFLARLRESEGNNLYRVVLFGSVARGDAREDSDIDILVVVREGADAEILLRAVDISTDIDIYAGECRTRLAPLTFNLPDYLMKKEIAPLFDNIAREGIVLYEAA